MKYSTVVAIFIGAVSAIELNKQTAPKQIHLDKKDPIQQVQKNLTLQKNESLNVTASTQDNATVVHQPAVSHIQISVKQNATAESAQKSKVEELEAMESALRQATEETHRKMLEAQGLTVANTTSPAVAQNNMIQTQTENKQKALVDLEQKQQQEEQNLIAQMTLEEQHREAEMKENLQYENDLREAEKERKNQEALVAERAKQLKLLQEEEAIQKAEAEKREQEFLQAQAEQETKAAAAKRAAARANMARLKRKHELEREAAEAKLKMLKIKQESEAEQLLNNKEQQPVTLAQMLKK